MRASIPAIALLCVAACGSTSSGDDDGGDDDGAGPDAGPGAPRGFCASRGADPGGDLPGFDTDSECVDFAAVPSGDVPCSGAANDGASLDRVELAQTHLLAPSNAPYDQRDDGVSLVPYDDAIGLMPRFRLVSHRPALVLVGVTGTGAAPDVRVTAWRGGVELGSLCLRGPATLPAELGDPSLDERFSVTLPADWIRPGLSLDVRAGGATRTIAADELAIAGGLVMEVVEVPLLLWGNTEPARIDRFTPELAAYTPAQALVWTRFPVAVAIDPVVLRPGRVAPVPEDAGFDLIALAIDTAGALQRANGLGRETKFYGTLDRAAGGGLGGGNAAGGDPSDGILHHELGHTYGLPHLGDWYAEAKYPFAGGSNPGGGSVGPFWAYDQLAGALLSPTIEGRLRQDPMQGGAGEQDAGRRAMFFGAFSAQVITQHSQDRRFHDDVTGTDQVWDADVGEFVAAAPPDDDGYGAIAARDVPVYTIFGTFARDGAGAIVAEGTVVQPALHYRGHLLRNLDVTDADDLAWLRAHVNAVCYWGCDYTVRVRFASGAERHVTIVQDTKSDQFVHWAVNVPADDGAVVRAELYYRPLRNRNDADDPDDAVNVDAATALDGATLLAARDF